MRGNSSRTERTHERQVRPWRRLHWRLTVSYMLVTLLATFVAEALLFGTFLFLLAQGYSDKSNVAKEGEHLARDASRYLDHSPPDWSGLTVWLQEKRPGYEIKNVLDVRIQTLVATDTSGLVVSDPDSRFPPKMSLAAHLGAADRVILKQALMGVTNVSPSRTGQTIMAVPLRETSGHLRGALFVRVLIGWKFWQGLASLSDFVLPSLLAMTLVGGLVGAVFGAMASRGLTQHLRQVNAASDAWSRGDFRVRMPERLDDEMGMLGKRLNRMAGDLSLLLDIRQRLAASAERERLARDLHDTVKQHAFAASMQISAAQALLPPDAPGICHVASATALIEHIQRDLMTILQEISLAEPEPDFSEALSQRCAEWSKQTGIVTQTDIVLFPITPEVSRALQRIVDEALANIARHSNARHVSVVATQDAARNLRLTVTDNGCGFDSRQPRVGPGGMGLNNMRQRAEALPEGTFTLVTAPTQGVRITVECRP